MAEMTLEQLIESLYSQEIQEIEDAFYPLLCRLDINNMTGVQLRNLAKLVGQPITSLDDQTMRTLIHAKIAENNSSAA